MRRFASLTRDSAWLTNAALVIFGLLLIEFCRIGAHEYDHYTLGFSTDVFCQLVLFLGAISLVERSPTNRWTLGIILSAALLARLVCVFDPAFLSSDLYRYVWDGKVQAHGINPYRYIPADPHLRFLRDEDIYPNINRADYAHTIYPPGAEFLFLLITRISATEAFMKLAMVGFEVVTCLVLMRLLPLLGQPRERVVIYAWCPLAIWEIASSGHVDGMVLTFIALAVLYRLRHKPGAVGFWLGAATLVKLYPAALLPAFFRRREWRMPAILVGMVAVAYACYSSVGSGVLGFLPTYAQEEGIDSGVRFFPLMFTDRLFHVDLPTSLYLGLCVAALAALSLWAYRKGMRDERGTSVLPSALVMAVALSLCFAPHYPWYFLWLLPLVTLYPWRPAFFYVLGSSYLFWTQFGAPGEPSYELNEILYSGFFLFLAYDLVKRFLHARRTAPPASPDHPAQPSWFAPVREQ